MDEHRQRLEDRLLSNRSIEDRGHTTKCWIWTKSCQPKGYGQTSLPVLNAQPRNVRVHRVAAWLWLGFGLDSEDLVLHHCDQPRCFNPDHLFVGTAHDNTQDMMRKKRNRNKVRRGEDNPGHVLTENDVLEIRAYVAEHGTPRGTFEMLAQRYGVSGTKIHQIVRRQSWTHI